MQAPAVPRSHLRTRDPAPRAGQARSRGAGREHSAARKRGAATGMGLGERAEARQRGKAESRPDPPHGAKGEAGPAEMFRNNPGLFPPGRGQGAPGRGVEPLSPGHGPRSPLRWARRPDDPAPWALDSTKVKVAAAGQLGDLARDSEPQSCLWSGFESQVSELMGLYY